jgi:hypothetical protein
MDTDDDFMSNVSSDEDMIQDDSENELSGDDGWYQPAFPHIEFRILTVS